MAGKRSKTFVGALFVSSGSSEFLRIDTGIDFENPVGVRIKKVEVQLDAQQVASWATNGVSLVFGVSASHKQPAFADIFIDDKSNGVIVSFSKARTSNAIDCVTEEKCNYEWVAPNGVIVTTPYIWLWARIVNASMVGGIHFRIYYEDAVLTQLELIQLAALV